MQESDYLLLLLGEGSLDSLVVQKLGAELEGEWKLFVEILVVFFELELMLSLKSAECLGILTLGLKKVVVPLLVELVVLLDVSVLTLLSLLCLLEDELVQLSLIVLVLKLSNSVFGHFSFNILAFNFTSVSVFLKDLTTRDACVVRTIKIV